MNAPAAFASCGSISGTGLAQVNKIGFSAIADTISFVMQCGPETPIKTSAPFIASPSVPFKRTLFVSFAISVCAALSQLSPSQTIPFKSHTVISFTPKFKRNFAIAIPAAPAPFITSFILSFSLCASFNALMSAAVITIAVPCWSS